MCGGSWAGCPAPALGPRELWVLSSKGRRPRRRDWHPRAAASRRWSLRPGGARASAEHPRGDRPSGTGETCLRNARARGSTGDQRLRAGRSVSRYREINNSLSVKLQLGTDRAALLNRCRPLQPSTEEPGSRMVRLVTASSATWPPRGTGTPPFRTDHVSTTRGSIAFAISRCDQRVFDQCKLAMIERAVSISSTSPQEPFRRNVRVARTRRFDAESGPETGR